MRKNNSKGTKRNNYDDYFGISETGSKASLRKKVQKLESEDEEEKDKKFIEDMLMRNIMEQADKKANNA